MNACIIKNNLLIGIINVRKSKKLDFNFKL